MMINESCYKILFGCCNIFNIFFWHFIRFQQTNPSSVTKRFNVVFGWCIDLTFFDSSLNSFLFEITFFSLSSKSVFFTKLAISILIVEFVSANLAQKISDVNLLNSWSVIYSSWSWSAVILISILLILVLWSVFLKKSTSISHFIFNSSISSSSN